MISSGPCPGSSPRENTTDFAAPVLTATQDRFGRRKNSRNTSALWLLRSRNTSRNQGRNGTAVTTSHLFWPNQLRNVGHSLRFWLPNSEIFDRTYDQKRRRGGGSRSRAVANMPRSISSHGIFCLMDPLPCPPALKKNAAAANGDARRRRRRRQLPPSHEFAIDH